MASGDGRSANPAVWVSTRRTVSQARDGAWNSLR